VASISPKYIAATIVASVLSILAGLSLWQFIAPALQPESPPAVMTAQQAVAAKALAVGSQRPLFSLADVDGVVHSIDEWDGKLLVVNFWATWCPPCLAEIPGFIKLQSEYGDRGLQFIGVALDNAENVRKFADEHKMNYPSLQGQAEAIEIGKTYGNRYGALPFTVIISPQSKVLKTHAGILEFDEAKELIEKFLANS